MGKKKPRPRRSFTPEFTAEIVELCRRGDRSVGQIGRRGDRSVGQIAKDFVRDPGGSGVTTPASLWPVSGRNAFGLWILGCRP
ncbi:transposase [Streptomyces sp. NBC_00005]|uniref:transposase n=1 Tax=Streptomyces sp. NBC_00005 TaxID=2903609 RepID=UPI0032469ED7